MKPKAAAAPFLPTAVRTVAETDDVRTIEGLAYPFRGRDTYGTFFSVRTDFHWDLYPDVVPGATRSTEDPKFIRPNTFNHGFDPEIGLSRVGGWSPVRMDADGVWVQAQIDKRGAYYATRLKPLLDGGHLGLSGGSAEHSVRIDNRSGEVLDWPAYELALTPTESNPLAQLAVRAAETGASLRIVSALADRPVDAVLEEPPATRGIQTFSDIQASAVMDDELPEAFDTLRSAIYSAIWAIDADFNPETPEAKQAAIATSLEQFRTYVVSILDQAAAQPRSGVRAGARNSVADQAHVDAIHTHAVALGAAAHSDTTASDGEDAARSGDPLPAIRVVERVDPAALRDELLESARKAGEDAARRLTG